jgi:hypothetical protein
MIERFEKGPVSSGELSARVIPATIELTSLLRIVRRIETAKLPGDYL